MSGDNLIPNGDFHRGLDEWESTPTGVTFVQSPTKRFVLVASGTRSAAICSEPINVVPGAVYRVDVERALRGDCDVSVIGVSSLLRPNDAGEIVAEDPAVRVQLTAKAGNKFGVSRVGLTEVGQRARLTGLRSTSLLKDRGEPFDIICTIQNTGSQEIQSGMARIVTSKHLLAEDAKQEQLTPPIGLGSQIDVVWLVLGQRGPVAEYAVEFAYGLKVLQAQGTTLEHRPHLPSEAGSGSVASGRRWFSVASRALRLTAHETDLDFGPCLLTLANGKELGVLRALCALIAPGGEEIPMYAKQKGASLSGVELRGKNNLMSYEISVSPNHALRGIDIAVKTIAKKRLAGYSLLLAPFQTLSPVRGISGGAEILGGSDKSWLTYQSARGEIRVSESSKTIELASVALDSIPGNIAKSVVTLVPESGATLAR